jgi:hypothetical protein
VKVSNGSESTWQISNAYKEDFRELLDEAKNWEQYDSNITIRATLKISFERDGPELAMIAERKEVMELNSKSQNHSNIISRFTDASNLLKEKCK